MPIQKKNLREYRKTSPLNQSDIAYLMRLPDTTSISRWEQGVRKPSLDVRWLYYLLFDAPMENLLPDVKETLVADLGERIVALLNELGTLDSSQKVRARVSFLENILVKMADYD